MTASPIEAGSPIAPPARARTVRPTMRQDLRQDPWHAGRIALAAVAMFLTSTAFYAFSLADRPLPGELPSLSSDNTRGDVLNMMGWIALYAVCGLTVLRSIWTQGIELRLALLLPFALYVLASTTWTYEPRESLVFAVMLVANIVVADALATQVHPRQLLSALARVVIFAIAVSLVLLVFFPRAVISDPERPGLFISGEFFGVFSHKGYLGINAALAILVMLFLPGAVSRWERRFGLAVCTVALALANAAGAVLALAVAASLILAARAVPRLRSALFVGAGLTTGLVSVLLPHLDVGAATEMIGRSSNLTGRGEFWPLAPGYIAEHPWFGYGYGGFFQRDPYSMVWDLWSRSEYFFTPNFHNTALDVTILLGIVGLAAYLVILAVALSVFANRSLGVSADLLTCALILFTVSSATEFQFLRHNSMATVMLFYAFLAGGRVYAMPARRPERALGGPG